MVFFVFLVLSVYWASWNCGNTTFITFGKISAIVTSFFFFCPSCLLALGDSNFICIRPFDVFPSSWCSVNCLLSLFSLFHFGQFLFLSLISLIFSSAVSNLLISSIVFFFSDSRVFISKGFNWFLKISFMSQLVQYFFDFINQMAYSQNICLNVLFINFPSS